LKVLGRGGYGKVMLVCFKPTQKLYAMKILRKDLVEKLNSRMYTQNERNIMVLIENPFIVKLHYAFQTRFKLYLIMDFMIGGTFPHYSILKVNSSSTSKEPIDSKKTRPNFTVQKSFSP
jgi:serine/threonine protein kinase